MKLIEKIFGALVAVAAWAGALNSNVWADDDFAPVREETMLTDEQIEELLKLSRGRGSVSSKTTFSASETKEFSAYLFALFFVEFDRKLNEYKRLADKAIVRMRLDLDYEFPSILPVSIASSEDVETKAAKIASDAELFVHIYAGKRAAKKM